MIFFVKGSRECAIISILKSVLRLGSSIIGGNLRTADDDEVAQELITLACHPELDSLPGQ